MDRCASPRRSQRGVPTSRVVPRLAADGRGPVGPSIIVHGTQEARGALSSLPSVSSPVRTLLPGLLPSPTTAPTWRLWRPCAWVPGDESSNHQPARGWDCRAPPDANTDVPAFVPDLLQVGKHSVLPSVLIEPSPTPESLRADQADPPGPEFRRGLQRRRSRAAVNVICGLNTAGGSR